MASSAQELTTQAATIHPTALVDSGATLGKGVIVGPFCSVGPDCVIGDGTELKNGVVLEKHVTLGKDCVIGAFTALGGAPQDLKYKGETSYVKIGDRVRLGEYVSIHRATGENAVTEVGDDSFLMTYAHVGHNGRVGKHTMIANAVQLAGHVVVQDGVVIGGSAAIHQHVQIGRFAMVGGITGIRQDVPPFTMVNGSPAAIVGLNLVGLRRNGFSPEDRKVLQRGVRLLFMQKAPWSDKLAELAEMAKTNELLNELYLFVSEKSNRGVLRANRQQTKASGTES